MLSDEFPAKTLEAVSRVVEPKPLRSKEQLQKLYRPEVNRVRGEDIVLRMKIELEDAFLSTFYKAFVIGHSGVGKSTEMSRLFLELEGKYEAIPFSARLDLDPGNLEPYDVVLLMLMLLVEQSALPIDRGGLGFTASKVALQPLLDWLAEETDTTSRLSERQAELAAGVGVSEDSFLAKVLGVFASAKGELRYAASRRKERIEYRLRRLSELITIANRILAEYRRALRDQKGKEWIFLGEDFDKGFTSASIEKLFLNYGSLFRELETHLIFSIPVALAYSQKAAQLPFGNDRILNIPDTPVFDRQHQVHEKGRAAVRAVLAARVDPDLFEAGQLDRLIVASGGNLRDLFSMVRQAALNARIRQASQIGEVDSTFVINQTRITYQRRLGESPFDPDEVNYAKKAQRLVEIYNNVECSDMADPVLYSLLNARAVQEFNGERWFGVHPLVVEILERQGHLATATATRARTRKRQPSGDSAIR